MSCFFTQSLWSACLNQNKTYILHTVDMYTSYIYGSHYLKLCLWKIVLFDIILTISAGVQTYSSPLWKHVDCFHKQLNLQINNL